MDLFGVFNEELFEEMEDLEGRIATKQEKLDLLEFIGGFSAWELLDSPLQMHVVSFLDYWTRCNLSQCSHSNHQLIRESVLVSSKDINQKDGGIRLKPKNLAALCKSDYEQKHVENIEVESVELGNRYVELKTFSGMVRSWKFNQREGLCTVNCKSKVMDQFKFSKLLTIENGNADVEFVKRAQKVLNNSWQSMTKLDMAVKWDSFDLPPKFPKLKYLNVGRERREQFQRLISRLCPETALDELVISYWGELPKEDEISFDDIDIPSIVNAKSLITYVKMDVSEEQFLSLQATRRQLNSDIRTEALEEFVRRWVDDEIDNEFMYCFVYSSSNFRPSDYTFTKFDFTEYNFNDFRSPHRGFFEDFHRWARYGKFYQVPKRNDPFTSVSVLINDERFVMIRTGTPCIRNGRQDVRIVVPEELLSYYRLNRGIRMYF